MYILIVEDTVDLGEILGKLVTRLGHDCRLATCGAEAISLARQSPPDLILLDIGLPDMDGYTTARRLRGDPRLSHVRIVALSAFPPDWDQVKRCGIDMYLRKPVDSTSLARLLERQSDTIAPSNCALRGQGNHGDWREDREDGPKIARAGVRAIGKGQ